VSDFFKVRTAFPSINHVKVSGCQSTWTISGFMEMNRLDEIRTHGVVVVVAEGIGNIPMFTAVGLVGYRKR